MEQIGFCGLIKLSTQIILKNLKHFLRIGLIFALPYALSLIVLGPSFMIKSFQTLTASISLLYKLTQGPLQTSDMIAYDEAIFTRQLHYPPSLLCILLFIFSIYIIFLVCSPLVAFSVCRACIHKSLDLKGSLRGVSRSAINLVLVAVCVAAAFLAFWAVAVLVAMMIAVVLSAVKADLTIAMTIWTMGVLIGGVYMAVGLSLADAVAILEEKKGWEAMRRSVYLMKGREGTAFALYCVYGVILCMVPLFVVRVSEEAVVVWRWSAGGISLGMCAFIGLCSMVARVVLYMSCKSLHEEPLDTLVAASPQFGPLHDSVLPKYLDFESPSL